MAVGIIGVVIVAAIASSSGGKKTTESTASESTTSDASAPAIPLKVRSPYDGKVVKTDSVAVHGISAPGSKLRIAGGNGTKRAVADRRGHWKTTYALTMGENDLSVNASKPGFTAGHSDLSVTRHHSDAELAVIRQKREQRAAQKRANFIASAKTIPYNQLQKNSDRYAGTKVKYTGQIFQIQEDYGASVILLSVTNDGYGFWDDNVWIDYDGTINSAEDDVITIYGTVSGQKTYKTQIGGETYVPRKGGSTSLSSG